ncbi:MAG: LCP family protein [candidate division WS1 bacterium]|jgi:LCP family protein required for cell wall assembly|nr:LCP family protein [candidate division WS1 bacterium]
MRTLIDYLIYVCAFSIIGVGALGAWDAVSEQPVISRSGEAENGAGEPLPPPKLDRMTILLVGADERPEFGDRGRSDTMILLFVDGRTKKAAMLSIPRDLRVRIPRRGTDKINASFALGGIELVKETIESEFDVRVDATAKVDFRGFVEVVDELGGVMIDVPDVEGRGRGMNYEDRADKLFIHLKPGLQRLDGEAAIGFVRYRKGDSDFKRSERQQQFLKAMVEQKVKLRNALDLARVVPKALEAVETDIGWRQAVDIARVAREIRSDNLLMTNFQPFLRDRMYGGIYFVEVSSSGMQEVFDQINQHLNSMPGQINIVDVLNGSGRTGVAAAAGQALLQGGFEINDTGNAGSFDHEKTLIYHPDDGLSAARQVQRILGTGELMKIDETEEMSLDRITVVLGSDIDLEGLSAGES